MLFIHTEIPMLFVRLYESEHAEKYHWTFNRRFPNPAKSRLHNSRPIHTTKHLCCRVFHLQMLHRIHTTIILTTHHLIRPLSCAVCQFKSACSLHHDHDYCEPLSLHLAQNNGSHFLHCRVRLKQAQISCCFGNAAAYGGLLKTPLSVC